jgi:phospholipase/carboxylesterase
MIPPAYLATKAYARSGVSRRAFVQAGLAAMAAPALPACLGAPPRPKESVSPRLAARPGTPTVTPTLGLSPLGLGSGRDGLLYVPQSYSPATALPLFVGLHGFGQSSAFWASYPDRAESRGMVFLAPDSRGQTWDAAQGAFGADVEFVDRALGYTFERCRIDPARVALAGFSDGATCALSLGLANGDLFTHIVAYSPGFILQAGSFVGWPQIFVSHGTLDGVIPVSNSRDKIVPYLEGAGYSVVYQEFEGGHAVPAEISDAALDWFFGNQVTLP